MISRSRRTSIFIRRNIGWSFSAVRDFARISAFLRPGFVTPQALRFLRAKKQKLEVAIFSHEPPNCAVALLRLAGIVRHLERQNRMGLHWCTARDPQIKADELINTDLFVIHREFCDRRISPQILTAARELN